MTDRVIEDTDEPATMAAGLRHAREQRGISQRELAARVSVSPSMISQIEAGQSQPSVNTLYAIVTELDVSMDELFGHRPGSLAMADAPDAVSPRPTFLMEGERSERSAVTAMPRAPVVVHPNDRATLRLETGVTWERLASADPETLDLMEVVYDVGGTSSRDGTLMRHNSVEMAVLLSGSLEVQVGFDVHHLEPGDSIAFDSTIPHRLWNPGTEPARAIWLVLAH